MGLAGTYMPGLKLMTDRLGEHPRLGRYVAYYTAGFSLGTALSFPFTAEVEAWLGWRAAFAGAAVGALLALLLVLVRLRSEAPAHPTSDRHPLDFRPVFRNRAVMAFVWGYAGHVWELFALRSWLVAFLIHVQSVHGQAGGLASVSWIAAGIAMVSTLSSIYGAEAASRSDRRQVISRVMLLSMVAAAATGFSAPLPLVAVALFAGLYHMIVMADSAALTGGAVTAARPDQRGATLAVHTIMGFSGGFVGPLAVGVVLDLAGGTDSNLAWGLAFLAMGAGSGAALIAIRKL
jgi:predicted MFS family arabinose efflux permease